MPPMENAKRSLLQATYTPVRTSPATSGERPVFAFVKYAYASALHVAPSEVEHLWRRAESDGHALNGRLGVGEALGALERIASRRDAANPLANAPAFANVPIDTLVAVAYEIRDMRSNQLTELLTLARDREQSDRQPSPSSDPPRAVPEKNATDVSVTQREAAAPQSGAEVPEGSVQVWPQTGFNLTALQRVQAAGGEAPKGSGEVATALAIEPPTLDDLLEWGRHHQRGSDALQSLPDILHPWSAVPLPVTEAIVTLRDRVTLTDELTLALDKHPTIDPIGYLHLERLNFTPAGIQRGELVYSLPLAPTEEANIAHKEWATRSEEFERIVDDFMENYSETGVAEKAEIAQSTSSQHQHSSGLNTGVTASGSYGTVSVTATLSANVADSASQSEQSSRNQSSSLTRKASVRAKQEHKVSFKLASAAGTEDEAVRRIRNPFPDKAIRLDYYQLIRKWRVDLYRYGVRLTYDLAIPEPAGDLFAKFQEIQALSASLEQEFGGTEAIDAWARFAVTPAEITRSTYEKLAAQYGASVPTPPVARFSVTRRTARAWATADAANNMDLTSLDVEVPEGYGLTEDLYVLPEIGYWTGGRFPFVSESPKTTLAASTWFGATDKLSVSVATQFCSFLQLTVRATFQLTDHAYADWQMQAWKAMRDAALERYDGQRQLLKDRLARLMQEMGSNDALTLRKIEREEVMKGVLRWLFGPTFRFISPDVAKSIYGSENQVIDEKTYRQVLEQGDLITFLHHAIEWENMLYFLYPYFWSHGSRWNEKRDLFHPDPMHRVFLKAGSARVILTIRPGFEKDFIGLLEKGVLSSKPTAPYMSVVDEMEAYAHTNYPGIPAASPEGATDRAEGKLIGTWWEYTPTSALDIAMNDTLPTA